MNMVNGFLVGEGRFEIAGPVQQLAMWIQDHRTGDLVVSTGSGAVYKFYRKPNLFKVEYISDGHERATDLQVGSIISPPPRMNVQNAVRVNKT